MIRSFKDKTSEAVSNGKSPKGFPSDLVRSAQRKLFMSVLSSIGRIATQYAAARARHRSERILLSLPAELRKDIGFPELFDAQNSRRATTFSAKVI